MIVTTRFLQQKKTLNGGNRELGSLLPVLLARVFFGACPEHQACNRSKTVKKQFRIRIPYRVEKAREQWNEEFNIIVT